MISVVCPFYREENILEASVKLMLHNLSDLQEEWELIIVNDGSDDGSLEIAHELEKGFPRLHVASYPNNRGRGYAIRYGISHSKGDIIVTTEIDSSWGDDIVQKIIEAFEKHPDADIIIASPHLPNGGYKNVPFFRVLLSTWGNYFIRSGLTYNITMNTGMTRGYRRDKFLAIPLDEDEKEMHLEILNKAIAFEYRIYEIPAILEWRDHKLSSQPTKKRVVSFKLNKLIRTHALFSILAAPFRYLYPISILLFIIGMACSGLAIYFLFTPTPSIYLALGAMLLWIAALLIFGIGVLSQQGRALQRDTWRLRSEIRKSDPTLNGDVRRNG